jgi:hypothetical protein
MLLSIGMGGLTFAGADVGGFFGNSDSELMVRWMQAGSYTPFFRGHAHHDSKRREPWVFGEPSTTQLRNAVMARYALLPYWYTLFREAFEQGTPAMRPLWFEYPDDEHTLTMDDQWLVGADIIVKPVTSAGAVTTDIYLPGLLLTVQRSPPCLSRWMGPQALNRGMTLTHLRQLQAVDEWCLSPLLWTRSLRFSAVAPSFLASFVCGARQS